MEKTAFFEIINMHLWWSTMKMKDYIFVTGASGIGKTTLSNGLLAHYKT